MIVLISKRALRVSCLEFLNVVVPDVKGTRSPGVVIAVDDCLPPPSLVRE